MLNDFVKSIKCQEMTHILVNIQCKGIIFLHEAQMVPYQMLANSLLF